jgi:hypothetical protein
MRERCAEGMLDDDDACIRRDDDPFGRNRAVTQIWQCLVQRRDGGKQLSRQPAGSRHVERQQSLLGHGQKIGQANAANSLGDDCDSRFIVRWACDASHLSERRMAEAYEAGDLRPQGFLESWRAGDLLLEDEDLEWLGGDTDNVMAPSKTILEPDGRGGARLRSCLIHRVTQKAILVPGGACWHRHAKSLSCNALR